MGTTAPRLTKRFREALLFAEEVHTDQERKASGAPYVAHLLQVAGLVLEHGADEDTAIAALLHDTLEDQPERVSRNEIRARFGDRVLEIVETVTDADHHPKPPWRSRKERYLEALAAGPPEARLVAGADKLHNARAMVRDLRGKGAQAWAPFRGGKDGTLWYYRSVLDIVRADAPPALVHDLEHVVGELHDLA